MTQQPYYPQYPVAPQAPAPAYPQPAYPQPQYAQPFPGVQAPPVQPQVPLANGTLDDFYSQPNGGGGPSIAWSVNGTPKPEGTSYIGVVARDVTNGDIQQQTDPITKQPKFYKDGRPQFVMKVPLRINHPEFPEGEAVLFVRGQMREELVRAMSESGATGAPTGGSTIQVTLVQRKPSRNGGNPQNIFSIVYTPAGGAAAPSPVAAPPVPQAVAQPVAQPVPPAVPPYVQPVAAPQAAAPVPQAQPVAQPAPVAQAPAPAPAVPGGLTPEQQQLLAQLQGQQAQG